MLNTAKLQELNQYGAILVAGEVKNANRVYTEYALVYKGELVIKGEKASFAKRVKSFFEKAKNKGVEEYLEWFFKNYSRKIVDSKGLRGSKILTSNQKKEIFDYAKEYFKENPEELIQFADDFSTNNTGYMAMFDVLYINTDIMPGIFKTANSRLSWKAAIAHELEGHRLAALEGKTFYDADLTNQACDLLEEIQASIRANKYGKKLSQIEKDDLYADALERFQNYKHFLKDSKYRNYTFNQILDILWTVKK